MTQIVQMSPAELRDALARDEVLLVDVREVPEYAAERIPGALLYPLSTFEPRALSAQGRKLVMQCLRGGRSMQAAQRLAAAGCGEVYNLDGGITAWKEAGLPLIRIDPATGQVVEHGRV
jgi:rhodanese-related sulfurtransferase